MIGTKLIEEFIQSVALTHRIKGYKRCSTLLIAAPESGKTTITTAASCSHVTPIAVMSGRSVLKEVNDNEHCEFLLFNDLTSIRAMSTPASALLVVFLNQLTQDERGKVAFAGKDADEIKRAIGIIACIPYETFSDHRAKWKEMGFISRMVPFAYSYDAEIVAEIKNSIDNGTHEKSRKPRKGMPKEKKEQQVSIFMDKKTTISVRALADERSKDLGQIGIRLLSSYHVLIRAHALLQNRRRVNKDDLTFLRGVDRHVSTTECAPLAHT
jgi:hypothetical protein